MRDKNTFYVIGLMSGSSLDGLDICYARFEKNALRFNYEILCTECIQYDDVFRLKLKNAVNISAFEFALLHTELGKYFGALTRDFIRKNSIPQPDLVCSHGQTIFHQPKQGFTSQIGCGAEIAAQTNCNVVCDLRTSDLAYGGQGAPIVPVAEHYLFPGHTAFLNLGGIANISFHNNDHSVIAYDVCAANTLLNYFAHQKGMDHDKDGLLAGSGTVIPSLLDELNAVEFCNLPFPKSLGTEHIFNDWIPLFEKYVDPVEDKLATAVEHIAMQIGKETNSFSNIQYSSLLITGGGAFNRYLIERISHHSALKIVLPDEAAIQFKEALAMAFIGLLRLLEIPNCLASVTGASKNSIGGAIYLP